MEQRTGKTLVALAVADKRKVTRVLVVCPKRAINVWHSEISKHLKEPHPEFRVINYEQAIRQKDRLLRWNADMVVVDECHRIKARSAKQSRVCHALGRKAQYRLGLTGTAIANGIEDTWSQFKFIDPDLFPARWADFQERYLRMGGYYDKQIVGYRNLEEFNKLFHSRCYRVTLNEVKPAKTKIRKIVLKAPLNGSLATYKNLERDLYTIVQGEKIETPVVLALIQKLQQIANGFVITEKGEILITGLEKISLFIDQVLPVLEKKFVIFAKFLKDIERIEHALTWSGRTVQVVKGGSEYSGKFDTDCVIVQMQSGISIDLSAADTAIFYSTNYSYIDFEQCKSRIQGHHVDKVTYYHLIMEKTIEEDIYKALIRKTKVANLVCDKYRLAIRDK